MSDAFWAFLGIVVTAYFGYMVQKLNQNVVQVKTMVDGQKSAMQIEIDGLKELILKSISEKKPVTVPSVIEVDMKKAATVAESIKKANGH